MNKIFTNLTDPLPESFPEDKGMKGGSCNRKDCLAPGANWFNYSTRKHYCESCARMLNRENAFDAFQLFGHNLCKEEK
jgi:hypothetical protein